MKHLTMLSLLVLAGCSSTTTAPSQALSADVVRTNQAPEGARKDDPLLLNMMSCKWRDDVGVPAWIHEHCPNGVQACLVKSGGVITESTISVLANQRSVFLQDVGYPPYYVTYDNPQRWCQPSDKYPGS